MFTRKYLGVRLATSVLIALSVATAACSKDDEITEVTGPQPCSGAVTLSASGGVTPQFTWLPQCTAAGLFVQRVSDGAMMWSLSTTTTPLRAPINYGTIPATATGTAAAPLVTGVQYRVGIVSSDGGGIATALFTP